MACNSGKLRLSALIILFSFIDKIVIVMKYFFIICSILLIRCTIYNLPKYKKNSNGNFSIYEKAKVNGLESDLILCFYEDGSALLFDENNSFVPLINENCDYSDLYWGTYDKKKDEIVIENVLDKSCGLFIPMCFIRKKKITFKTENDSTILSKELGRFVLTKEKLNIPSSTGNWVLKSKHSNGICFHFLIKNCPFNCR